MHSEKTWDSSTNLPDQHEAHIQACTTSFRRLAGLAMPELVPKRWGYELIFYNAEYCMKQLLINPGSKTSMHFHINKHETLLVGAGTLTLKYKDGKGGDHILEIPAGEAFVIPPGFQHQLCATTEEVILIEASTWDDPEDSVRVHM